MKQLHKPLPVRTDEEWLQIAEKGTSEYLDRQLEAGGIAPAYEKAARANVLPMLRQWLFDPNLDRISPRLKEGIRRAIHAQDWEGIVNAYAREIRFGTGGIRGLMAFDRKGVEALRDEGLDAPILKGPNTLNNVVLLLKSAGVARYACSRGFEKAVIGYDSRVRGRELAELISRLFIAYGLHVYLFDEPCPYPEVTYAIPSERVKADFGILISASHNDFRYNGYKLSSGNGSQFSLEERDRIFNDFIVPSTTEHLKLVDLKDAPRDKLTWLSGEAKEDADGFGHPSIDMHSLHIAHVQKFLLRRDLIRNQKNPLKIGYSAFHGAGRKAVPKILVGLGFQAPLKISALDELNGMFPCFRSDPGKEQQPDPGDPRAADIAVAAFQKEYPNDWKDLDILIGTDPDADRCGVVVKVPEEQREFFEGKDYTLPMADETWAILLWYRLQYEIEKFGAVKNPETKFIVESHTSSDILMKLAVKHGLGFIKSWVGFAMLANSVAMVWETGGVPPVQEGRLNEGDERCHPILWGSVGMDNGKRRFNYLASEQSNGFSILGGPPPDAFSLGEDGHVRDKDGTIAALLMAEVAAWAKENGTSLLEILDEKVFMDPDVGLFVSLYEPDPLDGEYPGLRGDSHKRQILVNAENLFTRCTEGADVEIGGWKVRSARRYWTGKYDPQNYPGFPDEGIRFYFDETGLNWAHIRPSGTSNSMRFHVQLHAPAPASKRELIEKKRELRGIGERMIDDIREKVNAPRDY